MRINLEELFNIIHILEERMKEVYSEDIEIVDEDYYWYIIDSKKYDPTKLPAEFELGQVSFDWDELLKLKKETKDKGRVPISYHLGCLAEIFNVIKKNGIGSW